MENVGKELLTMLKAQYPGTSTYGLRNILCCTHQNLYSIEEGKTEMAADTIMIACDVLGVDSRPWLIKAELTRTKSSQRRQILERMLSEFDKHAGRAVAGFALFFLAGFSQMFGA